MGMKQPVIPLATHKYKEVACPICHFMQDLRYDLLASFPPSLLPSLCTLDCTDHLFFLDER